MSPFCSQHGGGDSPTGSADLGGILLRERGEGDVLGAMIGSLGLILYCEVEKLRGRAILGEV